MEKYTYVSHMIILRIWHSCKPAEGETAQKTACPYEQGTNEGGSQRALQTALDKPVC